jgi:hypothetical protein
MTALEGWENFYVIVGSSAGALIGLQFVVITLIAERPLPDSERASGAFATPSVVHFGVVLLLSAILSAPWNSLANAGYVWGLIGVAGLIYTPIVMWRMQKQDAYQPVFEDWLFHAILPFVAYAILLISALTAHTHEREALFLVGAASLLLMFIGIHNAWDAVTWHVFTRPKQEK